MKRAVTVGLAVVLAACSDSDTDDAGDAVATTSAAVTTSTSTTDAPVTTAADVAGAEGDLEFRVVEAVFPPGVKPEGFPDAVPIESSSPDDAQVIAEDVSGELFYILGPVRLDAAIIEEAQATIDPVSNGWQVEISMTEQGGAAFDALAAEVLEQQLAVVSGGAVYSAPVINATEFGGVAVITGNFTEAEVTALARQITGG